MYISIDKKIVWVQGSEQEEKAIRDRNRKAMYALEKREQERQRDIKARGYCPTCHVLLTIHHKCPMCNSVWSFHKTQH